MTRAAPFTRATLEEQGFAGFATVRELVASRCAEVPSVPGVYVVTRDEPGPPRFRRRSVGGWYKNEDPTVPVSVLRSNWIEGADVLYFGRYLGRLDDRIRDLVYYGTGCPVRHRGGRYLWQVQGSAYFRVGWKPSRNPVSAEGNLQRAFFRAYSSLPFANLRFG